MATLTKESSLKNVEKQTKKESSKVDDRTELVQREEIKDTPFTLITIDGKSFGAMGGFRLTEQAGSKAEIRKELKKVTWNRLIQVMMIMKTIEEENQNKTNK